MKRYASSIFLFVFLLLTFIHLFAQQTSKLTLPNGWSLSPAGKSLPLGDLPLNAAFSPNHKFLAVTNNGQGTQSIQLIDAIHQQLLDSRTVDVAWLGLCWSHDSRFLFASGGNGNYILKLGVKENKFISSDTIRLGEAWPTKISIAGICIDDKKQLLYAVTKENNSLYVIDIKSRKTLGAYQLGGEGYTCLLSPDRTQLYISCWGCRKVKIFDTQARSFVKEIEVGSHPNDMTISKKGSFLYVALADDNAVAVIDLINLKVKETLNTALYPNAPSGSTTNSVALSENEKTLYVANADNNCLAVFDVTEPGNSHSLGFIPTGWYPTSVRAYGKKLWVTNGKGFSSFANPHGPNPLRKETESAYQQGEKNEEIKEQYIGSLLKGTLSIIDMPAERQLNSYTHQVYENTPYTKARETQPSGIKGNPIPMKLGDSCPIKHVFYIIKENRTYDQVLGDVKGGNGDTSLVLFGRTATPNQHALAEEFVLLDNFYVDGEVSADGHNWSLGAYATDYLEKNWPTSYGGRGGGYDAEGTRAIANNKNGFIWDFCSRAHVSFRTYGEFADDYKANLPVLENHFCPYYTSWDQNVMDTIRFTQWKRDFDSLLTIGKVPQLNTLRFINDHTSGMGLGQPSPLAQVADNDLATGMFVDYLSHSPIWKESVVLIVEDDAQNGPDHVDAHRSTAYVAGGWVKRNYIDHTPYSTSSFLRTIELILGLPPMSQYDAAAEPLWRCFDNKVNLKPFVAIPAQVDLSAKNTAINYWQQLSDNFDLTKEDRCPDDLFNEVIWRSVKGIDQACPPPHHAAFISMGNEKEDD